MQSHPRSPGFVSNHLHTIVGSCHRTRLAFSFSAGTTTYPLACAARASLAHCARVYQPSGYRLQLVALSTIFRLFLLSVIVVCLVWTTRNDAILTWPGTNFLDAVVRWGYWGIVWLMRWRTRRCGFRYLIAPAITWRYPLWKLRWRGKTF